MKKIFMLLVAIAAMVFVSCSKDDDTDPFDAGGDGVITMTTEGEEVYFTIGTEADEIITVDWGDGQTKEYKGERQDDGRSVWYEINTKHTYSQAGTYSIKLTGLVIWLDCSGIRSGSGLTSLNVRGCSTMTSLTCYRNILTTLDVRGCTALTRLECWNNKLTSLDVSENSALEELHCGDNELTSKALNRIFTDLPKGKTWTDEDGYIYTCRISISNNTGSDTCNKSIAENKGWKVVNY